MDIVHSIGFAQHTAVRHVPMSYTKQNWKCRENPLGFKASAFPICQFPFEFIAYLFSLLSLLFLIHFQYLNSLEKLTSVSWLPTRLKQWPNSVLQALGSRCTENGGLGLSPRKAGPLHPEDHHGSWQRTEGLGTVGVAGRSLQSLEMSLQIRGRAEESRQPYLEVMEIVGARGE